MANNTVRLHLGTARAFLDWCDRRGIGPGLDLAGEFAALRRSFPATYGKVQDRHPARHLTDDQCRTLLAACYDGTWQGSRDHLIIRLGVLGRRIAEICSLTWGDLLPDGRTLSWTGKGRKARSAKIGDTLAGLLDRWQRAYAAGLGRIITPDDPIVCRMNTVNQHATGRSPAWGTRMTPDAARKMLLTRAQAAGLGHISPHDLRRTTANLLHSARTAGGAHIFDTFDIQRVLGHARLDTTQRYLNALDTTTADKAAPVLDL